VDRASGVAPHAVKFRAVGADADGPSSELEYSWDFGDGNGGSLSRDPERSYLEPGTYVATVTVTDKFGASSTDTVTITVTDPPANRAPSVRAAAAPVSGRVPLNVLLTAQGTDPDGDDLTYSWDFGDGSPAGSGAKASHIYRRAGVYTARVTARDGAGLESSATVEIVIGDPPANQAPIVRIAADPIRGSAPLAVRFTSAARDPEGEGMMYVWDFGDGGKAGGASATHTYATAGTYTATLTVTDAQGASATATMVVTVSAPRGAVRGTAQGSAPEAGRYRPRCGSSGRRARG
jgi:PKD repeat protein